MRGNITKRGKSSYQLKFEVPSEAGQRKTRYVTFRGTRDDAKRELTRLLAASDTGTLPEPTAMTVGAYISEWLGNAHEQSPKTLERYGELARCQIIPHLGDYHLQKLRPEHVQGWHSALLKTGLSPRTVGHAHRLLRLVLNAAVKNGVLTRNVAGVHRPPKVEDGEIEILSPEQISTVRARLEGHTLLPIVELALATGMRRGELLGLQWGDVDLDAGTLRVERSLEETKSGLRPKPPKTKRGRRNVSLPSEAVAMLRAHKAQRMRLRLNIGMGALPDDEPVFCNIEGRALNPHAVSRAWRRAIGREGSSFHALRHTHVSILIAAGVDILTISRRLGHSKATITLDTYGHIIGGADEAAAAAIGKALK
jgi:integrase